MQGMSEREYAARAGLSRGAIQKAKTAGRLVLHPDGSIDADASDARRAAATDPSKQRRRAAERPPARLGAEAEAGADRGGGGGRRNEALDTRVYARAAAWIAGLDRWSDERWAEAEREVERGARTDGPAEARPAQAGAAGHRPTAGSAADEAGSSRRTDTMSWTEIELAELRRAYASGTLG